MRLHRMPIPTILGLSVVPPWSRIRGRELEFDRHTGQGGNRLDPLGLRVTRRTAAAFLIGIREDGSRLFFVFGRGCRGAGRRTIPGGSRGERNDRERAIFGRSLAREQ